MIQTSYTLMRALRFPLGRKPIERSGWSSPSSTTETAVAGCQTPKSTRRTQSSVALARSPQNRPYRMTETHRRLAIAYEKARTTG